MSSFRSVALFLVVVLFACYSGCSQPEFTGKWQAKITLPETGKSLKDIEVFITRKGASVSGTINFSKVPAGFLPLSGQIAGERLSFTSEPKRGLRVIFNGKMRNPRLIHGGAILIYHFPQSGETKQDRVAMELYR